MGGVLLMAVVGLWVMGRMHSAGTQAGVVESARKESTAPREKWHGPVPSVIAERFIGAKTHDERLELIRNPKEVGPVMQAFFQDGPGAAERIDGFYPLTTACSGDLVFESYNVEIANAPDRVLSVSVDPQGAKVDFECYVRFGSVPWDQVLAGKATEASEVRVQLQQGAYFVREFGDEQKWVHLRATSPDFPETLDFYLDRQHPAVRDIQDFGAQLFRATLSIRAVNGSEKNRQFEISAVKALDWVEPD